MAALKVSAFVKLCQHTKKCVIFMEFKEDIFNKIIVYNFLLLINFLKRQFLK